MGNSSSKAAPDSAHYDQPYLSSGYARNLLYQAYSEDPEGKPRTNGLLGLLRRKSRKPRENLDYSAVPQVPYVYGNNYLVPYPGVQNGYMLWPQTGQPYMYAQHPQMMYQGMPQMAQQGYIPQYQPQREEQPPGASQPVFPSRSPSPEMQMPQAHPHQPSPGFPPGFVPDGRSPQDFPTGFVPDRHSPQGFSTGFVPDRHSPVIPPRTHGTPYPRHVHQDDMSSEDERGSPPLPLPPPLTPTPGPSVYGPTNHNQHRNPLPAPPRDVYEFEPYRSLRDNAARDFADILNYSVLSSEGTADSDNRRREKRRRKGLRSLFGSLSRRSDGDRERERERERLLAGGMFRSASTASWDRLGAAGPGTVFMAQVVPPGPPGAEIPVTYADQVRQPSPPLPPLPPGVQMPEPAHPPPRMPHPQHQPHRSPQMPHTSPQRTPIPFSHSPNGVPMHPPQPIRFHADTEYRGFIPHSEHSILYNGKLYPTAMHLLEAFKFLRHQPHLAEQIRTCGPVDNVFRLSEELKGEARPGWEHEMSNWMDEILYLKFTQHPELREMLLDTGVADLIYAEARDNAWGEGPMGQGANWLGRALMRLRDRLRQEMGQ